MKVIAVIPVKSHSDRIESKNIKLLAGKPLFIHTLEKLLTIKTIDEVWIDTDDMRIITMAHDYSFNNFKYFIRDKQYSDNNTDGNLLLKNEIDNIDADIYIQVLCTSPFLKIKTIQNCIDLLTKKEHTSIIGCYKNKFYSWKGKSPQYDINNIPNSTDLETTLIESMALYGITKQSFIKCNRRIGDDVHFLYLDKEESIDINYHQDFVFANKIAVYNKNEETTQLNMLKIKLNSCILSDILNELGYKNNILQNYKPNMKNNKLFGRVKPIQIRELKSNEDYTNIYKCLDSYESIHQGDIIFVNNLIDNKAYFGDLNATISISKNCQGTIINGYTRDINRTVELNYPTFFKNNTCSDVKFYGSLDYFDKPITVENITIYNNNLIFADIDGIVIIPKDKEDIILTKCKQIINLEENISSSIINGKSIKEIIKTDGFF